jgi:hypothetical protein
MVGSCEQDKETSDPIKGREFLEYLTDYYLYNKDGPPYTLRYSAEGKRPPGTPTC